MGLVEKQEKIKEDTEKAIKTLIYLKAEFKRETGKYSMPIFEQHSKWKKYQLWPLFSNCFCFSLDCDFCFQFDLIISFQEKNIKTNQRRTLRPSKDPPRPTQKKSS